MINLVIAIALYGVIVFLAIVVLPPLLTKWSTRPRKPKPEPEPEPFRCTYCGGDQFYSGPQGGMCTNILCANVECRHWFNDMVFKVEDLNKTEPRERMPEEV